MKGFLLLLSLFPPPTTSSSFCSHFSNLSSPILFTSFLFHLSVLFSLCPVTTSSSFSLFLTSTSSPPCLARGHSRPADQVQHVRQRHGQVGVHSPPRSGPEGEDSALRAAIGPRSRSHHEEPGGTDAAGLGDGTRVFL